MKLREKINGLKEVKVSNREMSMAKSSGRGSGDVIWQED